MSYLCGMQDNNLALRETLKTFINNSEYTHELKFRCLTSRRAYYESVSIGFDAETFEKVILKNLYYWDIFKLEGEFLKNPRDITKIFFPNSHKFYQLWLRVKLVFKKNLNFLNSP